MLSRFLSPLCLSLVPVFVATVLNCAPASYEILKPKSHPNSDQNQPPQNANPTPTPDDKTPAPLPPRAAVEVIVNGKSVVTVQINTPTTVRPTVDTVSPSYISVSKCVNQGIVRADYDLGGLGTPSVQRSQGCEDLGVPKSFPTPGDYLIKLRVTDVNNKTADASMILTVVDDANSNTRDGGFTIIATPPVTQPNKQITFNGYCQMEKAHTITWDFGDGSSGTGEQVAHAYGSTGAYTINAKCVANDNSATKTASTSVTITDQQIDLPRGPDAPQPRDNPVVTKDQHVNQQNNSSANPGSGSYANPSSGSYSSGSYFGQR